MCIRDSIATISYFSNGSKQTSKEYLEVYSGNKTAIIDDFKVLSLFDSKTVRHTANQDKGYKNEVASFVNSIKEGKEMPIPFEELYLSTLASFKAIESVKRDGEKIIIS